MKILFPIIGLVLVVAGIQGLIPLLADSKIDSGYLAFRAH
jgi:hypothetical protein